MNQLLLFTPDTGILVLTFSTLLIFAELNRPGMVLPGSMGLLGVLLVVSSWRQWQLNSSALLLLLASVLVCLWQLRRPSSAWWALPCALGFSFGFATLIRGPAPMRVHLSVAVACGCLLGGSGSVLASIAHRARQSKGLN